VRLRSWLGHTSVVDKWQAVERLLDAVPEFASDYEASGGHPDYDGDGDLLLHVVMGDLGRFYMEQARGDEDLARRFWRVVEELATKGNEDVQNAVEVSLIEWFAWGDEQQQAALAESEPQLGRATWMMVQAFRPRAIGSRKADRKRTRRNTDA
jgi:hypothetical protein